MSTVPRRARSESVRRRARARRISDPVAQRATGTRSRTSTTRASAQRPAQRASRRWSDYSAHQHANVHRGVHTLSQEATALFEAARERVRRRSSTRASTREIVFVARHHRGHQPRGAESWRGTRLRPGDEILITAPRASRQHRAVADGLRGRRARGSSSRRSTSAAKSRVQTVDALLTERTRIVAVAHVSNALGTVLPVAASWSRRRRRAASPVLLDGAQAVPHLARRRAARWAAISMPSPATRCTGRPASACSTAARRCSRRCRRGRAAAT